MPPETRLELLWSCIRALRAFFRARYLHRDIDKPRYINLTTSDIAYGLITSIKLLALQLPGWDPRQVASELTLTHALHWQINDLTLIIQKRKSDPVVNGKAVAIAEDPWERLLRLLFNARELVSLQCQSGDMAASVAAVTTGAPPASQALLGELDESVWFDIVSETAWNMNDEIMSG